MAEQKTIEIVTGSTGAVHVTPIDDAVRNSNAGYIDQKVVFTYYENLSARAITANEVRVFSGYGMTQGRYFKIPRNSYQSVTIENGSQGVKRADLIVARYTMEAQTGFEDINLVVIRGQSGSEYVDPAYEQNDINLGVPGTVDDFPLYRVRLNGLVIEGVDQLFTLLPDGGRIGILEQRLDGKMITDLEKTSRAVLDGSENVDIGVKGTLPIGYGGTGATTAKNAAKNIVINSLETDTNTPTDATEIITSAYDTAFSTVIKKRTVLNFWYYVLSKIRAFLGIPSNSDIIPITHGGTGASSAATARTNIGLGNVNNTSDADKPISTATATALSGKAPTNHASSGTTYGIGTGSNYGHVKLTDTYNPTTASAASSGVGASQKAVKDAYQACLNAMSQAGYGDMLKATYDTNNNGVVDKAEKLNTARTLKVNLASTGNATFDGSANQTGIGVSGTLPIANGGTGETSFKFTKRTLLWSLPTTASYSSLPTIINLNMTVDQLKAYTYLEFLVAETLLFATLSQKDWKHMQTHKVKVKDGTSNDSIHCVYETVTEYTDRIELTKRIRNWVSNKDSNNIVSYKGITLTECELTKVFSTQAITLSNNDYSSGDKMAFLYPVAIYGVNVPE